jgi:hypothetical protein
MKSSTIRGRGVSVALLASLILATALLASCAAFPHPASDASTLVIGSFRAAFPEGFFNESPRTLSAGITVTVENLNGSGDFSIPVSKDGYFSFQTQGKVYYRLVSYSLHETGNTQIRQWANESLNYAFTTSPHSICYLGDITALFTSPVRKEANGQTPIYTYKKSLQRLDKAEDMLAYLKKTEPSSPWLSYDVDKDSLKDQ